MRRIRISLRVSSCIFFAFFLTAIIASASGQQPSRLERATAATPQTASAQEAMAERYAELPLSFEANQGQSDGQVRFLSRGTGYSFYLTKTGATLTFAPDAQGRENAFQMQLAGANGNARIHGVAELPGKSNYFFGSDSRHWFTGVPTYSKVAYENIYPGINLVYYGNQRQLEYDFVVSPGANPQQIRLSVSGAQKLAVDAEGNLVLHSSAGDVQLLAPKVYQQVHGRKQQISGQWNLLANNVAGFRLGAYDRTQALVIDPVLMYSSFLGGSQKNSLAKIAIDNAGNAYVAGYTTSGDFKTAPTPMATTFGNGTVSRGAFVAKIDPTGKSMLYSTYLSGNSDEEATGLAIDSSGNVYVAGTTHSTNFPTVNPVQAACATHNQAGTCSSAFLTKISASGSSLIFSTYLGGSGEESARGLAVDAKGSAYLLGVTSSPDFPVTAGAAQTKCAGSCQQNAFLAKFDPNGAAVNYATYLGGSGVDDVADLALDASGNVYVVGKTTSPDFPTVTPFQKSCTADSASSSGACLATAFVTKLKADGSAFAYSTYLGGSLGSQATDIAVDKLGSAYVTGSTQSPDFPVLNAYQKSCAADKVAGGCSVDAFLTKFSPTGKTLVYSTYVGGSGKDEALGIAVDANRQAYLIGRTTSPDFPTVSPTQKALKGASDAFVARFDATGTKLNFSTYHGGSATESAAGIAVDGKGSIFLAGQTSSADFPTHNAFQTSCAGTCASSFVSEIIVPQVTGTTPQTITVTTPPPASADYNSGFTVDATSDSGLAVAITTSGVCSGTGTSSATITMTSGTGICSVMFDQAGDSTFAPAPTVTDTVNATLASQTITVTTPPPASAAFNSTFTVAATASSGLTVTFSSAGGCTNASATYTMTSPTTACSVTFDQAGDANYAAAPTVTDTVNATKASQTITVTTPPPASAAFNSTFTVAATASSGLTVTFSSAGGCTNASATYTMTSGTTACSVIFDQAGDANYAAAPTITDTVNATKANQTITVTTPPPASAAFNSTFTVAATASSGLTVTFSSAGGCTNASATYTMTSGTTACSVIFNQAGNANYAAAPTITDTVNAGLASQTITVTTPPPASAAYNSSFPVAATASSSLAVAITTSGVCSGSGTSSATVTMTSGTGTCSVIFNQAGNTNYAAAPTITDTVSASKISTAISVTSVNPATEAYGQDVAITITAQLTWTGAGAAPTAANVSITGTGHGTYGSTICGAPSGTTMNCTATYTPNLSDSAGNYTESAAFSTDNNYSGSSSSQTNNFSIAPAATTTTITPSAATITYGQSVTFTATVSAVAPGGGTPVGNVAFTSDGTAIPNCSAVALSSGVAACSTTSLTATSPTAPHAIVATYSQTGGNFVGSASSALPFAVSQATATTTVSGNPNPSSFNQGVVFTATVTPPFAGTPTGNVTFSFGSITLCSQVSLTNATASCTYSAAAPPAGQGSVLPPSASGDTITASYSGDSNFLASTGTKGQVVTQTATVTSPSTYSPLLYQVNPDQTITFSVVVVPAFTGMVMPTGTVTFMDGTTTLGSGSLSSSKATFTTSAPLSAGPHTITAVYGGDTNFVNSTSSAQQVMYTAVTAPPAVISGAPTSSIQLTNGATGGVSVTYSCLSLTGANISGAMTPSSPGEFTGTTNTTPPANVNVFCYFSSVSASAPNPVDLTLCTAPPSAPQGFPSCVTAGTPAISNPVHGFGQALLFYSPTAGLGLVFIGFSTSFWSTKRRKLVSKRSLRLLATWMTIALLLGLLVGCGGGFGGTVISPGAGPGSTPAGSYSLTVLGTGSDGSAQVYTVPFTVSAPQ